MHSVVVLLLFAAAFEVGWSITDFSKIDFAAAFKKAEKNGGLSPLEMQAILTAHNTFRQEAANGRRDRMPKAAGLPLLEWDDRLAYEAQTWAEHLYKTKTFTHPSDIQVQPWGLCGQNLGSFGHRDMYSIMKGFEVEIDFLIFDSNTCNPTGNYYTCGHAKQIYYEDTTHVGCQTRKRTDDPASKQILVVCNYGRISPNGVPYTKGTPCSACKGSYPYCLNGLCTSKKVCELAGMDKCKCTRKDSDCGHGASVDRATCQCTKNCPADWVSPFCKSKCDNGEGMEGMCPVLYADKSDCVSTFTTCAQYCGSCVARVRPVGVSEASNVLGIESYPRAKNCEDATGLSLCATTKQSTCSSNILIAAGCARTCNRCLMLDGKTDWSKKCSPDKKAKCATSGLFQNVCQKMCKSG